MATKFSPDELAGAAMYPTWGQLEAVVAYRSALNEHLLVNLPGCQFDVPGFNTAFRLCAEFRASWPHHLPTAWELVLADRAGALEEKITELNEQYRHEKVGEV